MSGIYIFFSQTQILNKHSMCQSMARNKARDRDSKGFKVPAAMQKIVSSKIGV